MLLKSLFNCYSTDYTYPAISGMEPILGKAIRRLGATTPESGPATPKPIDAALVRRHQLGRLLPPDAVQEVLRHGSLPSAGDRRILTIMFVDIRGSSTIEETLSAELTIEFLNVYLGMAAQAILSCNGSVNRFVGDGILAVFGVVAEPDHGAADALAAAGAIHRAFELAKASPTSSSVRAVVSIHTGPAIIGVVGLAERSDYAVLGPAVNVASRLEGEAKELNLSTVLSGSTVAALSERPPSLHLVTRKVLRGLSDRVEIWSDDPVPEPDRINLTARNSAPVESAVAVRGLNPAQRRERIAFGIGAVFAGLFVIAIAVVFGLRLGSDQFRITLVDLATVAAALVAAAACAWRATASNGRLRRGWALIAVATAAWCAGEATLTIYTVRFGNAPSLPSLADIGFFASLPVGVAGLLAFWTHPVSATERWRALLDGLIVAISLTFAAWAFGLKDVFLAPKNSLGEQAIQLAYPLGKILMATLVILLVNRGARYMKGPLVLLLSGIAVGAIADVIFTVSDVHENFLGLAHAGWMVGFLVVTLAPLWPARRGDEEAESGVDMWQLALPWMAVALTALSIVTLLLQGENLDRFLTLLSAMLAALLAVSQVLAHRDSISMLVQNRLASKTLADIIAHAPIGIARTTTEFKVIDANPGVAVVLREPPGVLKGSAITKYLSTEIQSQMRQRLGELASGATDVVEAEVPMIRADGDHAWVHVTSTAVRKASGQVDYFLTMLEDNTTTHDAEEAAAASLAALENLNRLKTEFLHSVAHEFRTGLVAITGFSELLREGKNLNSNEVRDFAGEIHDGADHLDRVVNEFLDLDQIEASRISAHFAPVDLNGLIRREVEELKAGTDGLVITQQLEPKLPAVAADENKLSQVVSTLLQNAAKHSPDGGQIVIGSRTHVGQVEVSVRDQGQDFRIDFDDSLVHPDDIFANNPIRRLVGTGLGMGIVRQIIALHGGRAWVDALQGIGSEVHFTVPIDITARTAGRVLQGGPA